MRSEKHGDAAGEQNTHIVLRAQLPPNLNLSHTRHVHANIALASLLLRFPASKTFHFHPWVPEAERPPPLIIPLAVLRQLSTYVSASFVS